MESPPPACCSSTGSFHCATSSCCRSLAQSSSCCTLPSSITPPTCTSSTSTSHVFLQLSSLIWTFLSCLLRGSFSSLSLALRSLFLLPSQTRPQQQQPAAVGSWSLYEGTVWHQRTRPVDHKFKYAVRYALVDLDCPPSWFSSASASHHLSARHARNIAGTNGPVFLLTLPVSVGYEQNPLSVYYCFNDNGISEGHLATCLAEVTNTPWAERVTFMFDPKSDVVAKPLHVSPFMDMSGNWIMHASVPGRELSITISVQHPDLGNYFTAKLWAKRVDYPVRNPEMFLWLMPHKVAAGIYWQALRLWRKGVVFHSHPKYLDGNAYRERAIWRNQELQSLISGGLKEDKVVDGELSFKGSLSKTSISVQERGPGSQRFCAWQEAHWPWI